MIGEMVSHYRVMERLSLGTFGEVYKAEDTKLKRTVALKLLPAELSTDEQARKRFLNEAKAAGSLDHPHIASVHEVGETPEGQLFIAMAYTPGISLRQKLASGPLGVEAALKVATQVAEALEAAHAQGIVHRDITPQNIIISDEGDAKIVDFGLARLAGVERLTKTGDVKGTVAYLSPEQASGKEVDTRSDIWNLGVVLAESVSGKAPFEGATEGIPFEVERVVEKCLEKDRRDRYASASELVADLKAVGRGLETGTLKRMRPALRVKRSRVPVLLGAIGGVLLVAAVLVTVLWWKPWAPRVAERVTIVLLPLVNAGLPVGEEWYAEGMTDSLMTDLVKIRGLRVISQSSAKQIEADETIAQVGQKLGVDYVLKGSAGKDGEKLALSVQLWQVGQEKAKWEKGYTKASTVMDALAAEVAQEAARRAGVIVTAEDRARIASRPAISPEAYELYLKGRALGEDQGSLALMKKGIAYLSRALEIEPEWAEAWAILGATYTSADYAAEYSVAEPDLAVKGDQAVKRAIELDPTNADALYAVGYAAFTAGVLWGQADRWKESETSLLAAIAADPNHALARATYGMYLAVFKRFDEALVEGKEAVRLDPLSQTTISNLGAQYFWNRELDAGIPWMQKLIEMDPKNGWAAGIYCGMLADAGRYDEAITAAKISIDLAWAPGNAFLAYTLARKGDYEQAKKIAIALEAAWDPKVNPYGATDIAMIYANMHEEDLAMQWLEKSITAGAMPALINIESEWDPLRSIPRFGEIVRSQGLPE